VAAGVAPPPYPLPYAVIKRVGEGDK